MWNWNILIVLFLFTSIYSIHADLTDAQVKANFVKLVLRCRKTNPVGIADLLQLQRKITPTKTEVKCLLACAYRLQGLMNDRGEYDVETANRLADEAKGSKPAILAKAKQLVQVCSKSNELAVSDGEKGCERSAAIFECYIVNAPKFGFKT